jgi:hypothetical protein
MNKEGVGHARLSLLLTQSLALVLPPEKLLAQGDHGQLRACNNASQRFSIIPIGRTQLGKNVFG